MPKPVPLALSDLGEDLRERVIASCREREPTVAGILVHGSYARGTAHPESDLDLYVFVSGDPTVHYRTWFEERDGLPLLHVSARSDLTVDRWEEEKDEPEDWAFGLPVIAHYVWLWVGDRVLLDVIGDRPILTKRGSGPEIEDMVDAVLKMRRRAASGDDLGVRLEAQAAARYAAPTVAALNSVAPVADGRAALEAMLSLSVAPPRWPEDLVAALGLCEASGAAVAEAADRLAVGTLRLARELDPHVDHQPEIAQYLADGTLEAILA